MATIVSLPNNTFYRRGSGNVYRKLDKRYHAKTREGKGKNGRKKRIIDGFAERFNASEEVEVVQG